MARPQTAPATLRSGQSLEKRRAILAAATGIFLDVGYGTATMDEIAARAGVSKQTIYHHFGSKEMLFAAIVEERCEQFLAPIAAFDLEQDDFPGTLRALAADFMERVLSPSSLALHRLVVAEAARFPELGRLSYECGPQRIVKDLARFLETQAQRGTLAVPDPELSAEQFYGILLGFRQLHAILCNDDQISRAGLAAHVEQAVRIFLDGHRPA